MIHELKVKPSDADRDMADELRQLADRLEAGEISELSVVANIRTEQSFLTYNKFDDVWRLLGALEYAKIGVQRGMAHD